MSLHLGSASALRTRCEAECRPDAAQHDIALQISVTQGKLVICEMNQGLLCKWDLAGVVGRERGNAFRNEMRMSYVAIDLTWIAIVAFSIESGTRALALGSNGEWAKVA